PSATAGTLSPAAVTDAIVVENGTANAGRSRQLAATLQADGFKNATGVSYSGDVATTNVYYSTPQHQAAAQAVAAALQLPASAVQQGGDGSAPIVVRVGADFASGDVYNPVAATSSVPSALPSAALSSAAGLNAADSNQCVTAAGS
ncbi:LytR C-terminal domain-containing protein, partial [Catenulispora rubra]|uniref:LytR C-terminal domain-containing protein n=1 Tax=Catenulispora rubra TaxID=280293 RepID=UPI0018920DFF